MTLGTSVRAAMVLLAKTRYLGMGIELLQLLVSYESELHDHTLQELTRCLTFLWAIRLHTARPYRCQRQCRLQICCTAMMGRA
uniref:Uncharacterized protein n=1 Tax=Hyaloperonospora arabidopsidis (strain Emoy2) TaxID=559515 RepID=M4C277_HYAAE